MGKQYGREEVIETVKENLDRGAQRIKLQDLYDIGVSKSEVYDNFSSLEELEKCVFGIEDIDNRTFTCDRCGKEYDNKRSFITHNSAANHTRQEYENKAKGILGDSVNSPIAYKLLIQRKTDGQEFVYVGATESPLWRLTDHMRAANAISMPIDGKLKSTKEYQFLEFLNKVMCSTKEEAKEVERKMYLRHAIENDTIYMLGGK